MREQCTSNLGLKGYTVLIIIHSIYSKNPAEQKSLQYWNDLQYLVGMEGTQGDPQLSLLQGSRNTSRNVCEDGPEHALHEWTLMHSFTRADYLIRKFLWAIIDTRPILKTNSPTVSEIFRVKTIPINLCNFRSFLLYIYCSFYTNTIIKLSTNILPHYLKFIFHIPLSVYHLNPHNRKNV